MDKLHQANFDRTELGVILKHCRQMLDLFPNFCVVLVSKTANTVVHILTNRSLTMNVTQTFHLLPACIAETITNKMLSLLL